MNRHVFTGTPASAGVAMGFAKRTDRAQADSLPPRGTGDPLGQLTEAFDAVERRMHELAASLRSRGQREQGDIVEVAEYIAADQDLRALAIQHAEQGSPATVAIGSAVDSYATTLAELGDPVLAERAADVRQVGRRVLAALHGVGESDRPEGPLVLLAHELGAADLLESPAPVVAAASVTGGPNSHAAIVARSMGIPLLLGIDSAVLDCPDGTEILVDAERSTVTVAPESDERRSAIVAMGAARARRATFRAERGLPCETLDSHPVVLRANVATPADAEAALEGLADGIGLLRTELPFLDATSWPSYRQHTAVLTPIFRLLGSAPVTVRTLDYADDKLPPFLAAGRDGAKLGRGLPLMLAQPAAFGDQFRAIVTAGADSDVRIMIPMVADIQELRACKDLLAMAGTEAGVAAPPLGAMIELREAVADIDRIAAESAFLSIGSNDLTCQLLGLDRRDPAATPAMTAHPGVLRAIDAVVTAAHRHGRQVSVCGDAAAHPDVIPLLVGLGCDILSVAPAALDEVRSHVRRLHHATAIDTAAKALTCATIDQVQSLVRQHPAPDPVPSSDPT